MTRISEKMYQNRDSQDMLQLDIGHEGKVLEMILLTLFLTKTIFCLFLSMIS